MALALSVREIADPDVFEFHVALSTRVQLQGNLAIEGSWLGDGEVHHGYSVEAGEGAVSIDLDQIVVTVAHAHYALIFRGRPNHPSATVFGIYTCGVMHHFAVDLKLHTLGDVRGSGFEGTMKENSAIAITHAFKAQR